MISLRLLGLEIGDSSNSMLQSHVNKSRRKLCQVLNLPNRLSSENNGGGFK